MSATLPPKVVRGVHPKKPARKRKVVCAPMFGANADAMMKIMKRRRLMRYTGLRPTLSEKGPDCHSLEGCSTTLHVLTTNDPTPNAIR